MLIHRQDLPNVNGLVDSQAAKTILLNTESITQKYIFEERAKLLYQQSKVLLVHKSQIFLNVCLNKAFDPANRTVFSNIYLVYQLQPSG